jgi:folylpolyglutamate synthase/dihydropteroate synthase
MATAGVPKIICDTAHNRHGLEVVLNQIHKQKFEQLHIVLGVVNDKDLEEILPYSQRMLFITSQSQIIQED